MENQPFENSSFKSDDCPLPDWFSGVYISQCFIGDLPVDVSAYQKEGPIRKVLAESLLKDMSRVSYMTQYQQRPPINHCRL